MFARNPRNSLARRGPELGIAAAVVVGAPLVFSDALSGWCSAFASLFALGLMAILSFRFRRVPAVMILAWFALLVLPGFISAADRARSWTGLYLLQASLLVFLLVLWSARFPDFLRKWSKFVVGGGAILAVGGPLLFDFESKGRLLGKWDGLGWLQDSIDPNVLAGSLAMVLPLALIWNLDADRLRVPRIVSGLLLLGGLILTESIGGMAAALVSCVLLFAWTGWRWQAIFLSALFGVGILLGAILFQAPARLVISNLMEDRAEIWVRALYLFQEFAFTGVGPGSFGVAVNRLHPFLTKPPDQIIPHAHNLFLEVGVEMGVGGYSAFVMLVSLSGLSALRSIRSGSRPEPGPSRLLVGYVCGLIAHLVHGLVDSPLWMNRPMPLLFLFLGALASHRVAFPGSSNHGFRVLGSWVFLTSAGLVVVSYSPVWAMVLIFTVGVGLSWKCLKTGL